MFLRFPDIGHERFWPSRREYRRDMPSLCIAPSIRVYPIYLIYLVHRFREPPLNKNEAGKKKSCLQIFTSETTPRRRIFLLAFFLFRGRCRNLRKSLGIRRIFRIDLNTAFSFQWSVRPDAVSGTTGRSELDMWAQLPSVGQCKATSKTCDGYSRYCLGGNNPCQVPQAWKVHPPKIPTVEHDSAPRNSGTWLAVLHFLCLTNLQHSV